MVIRFYWGAGVGHVYSHRARRPEDDEDEADVLSDDNPQTGIEGDITEEAQNEDEPSGDEEEDTESEESESEDDFEDEEFVNLIEMYGEA